MTSIRDRTAVLYVFASMALGIMGCDDNVGPCPPPPPTPFDQIEWSGDRSSTWRRYGQAYERRDLLHYTECLSADFRFFGQDESRAYGRDEEAAIARKMFLEFPGEGGVQVQTIGVRRMERVGTWAVVPTNDPYFGSVADTYYCPYDIGLDFAVLDQDLTIEVRGLAIVYIIDEGNELAHDYRVLGIVDRTAAGDGAATRSWTAVKSMFERMPPQEHETP